MIMKTSDIQDLTVACLQQAVTKMMTFEWHKKISALPKDEQNEAKVMLADCQAARLTLENAQLGDIRDKLQQNEASLKKGRDELKKALEKLDNVKNVLNAVNSLLSVVSMIA